MLSKIAKGKHSVRFYLFFASCILWDCGIFFLVYLRIFQFFFFFVFQKHILPNYNINMMENIYVFNPSDLYSRICIECGISSIKKIYFLDFWSVVLSLLNADNGLTESDCLRMYLKWDFRGFSK